MRATIKILRFNPEVDKTSHWAEYQVDTEPNEQLLNVLHYIKWNLDGTLTLRRSCAHGICGSDAMVVNGRNRLACKVLMKYLGSSVTVEPIRGLRVIKDLVVDMEPFMAKYKSIMPYLINDEDPGSRERPQSPEERERFDDTTKCILCAACTTACPSFWANGEYVGPAAIVQAHRFIFDSRDRGAAERLAVMNEWSGVWRCRTIFNCVEACPRDINVTKAIGEVKKAILFDEV
ncbi:MAG: succinate dehydrogenase iron-sulfur subunit [Anaerolineae bacterium]|nr:succinate dehydrogenase iron-sulfur subunit [Anaerolineae bacterium]